MTGKWLSDSQRKYDEAIKCYDKAIELNPSDSDA
ncbi:MAG: tetratricopeptide repeat protein [Methanotrichaceae archaeon]